MRRQLQESGFTAVELLITLFVAAAFLIAGFQLFNAVIRDGGNARAESRAGNIAYDYLRRYASQTGNPCRAMTPLTSSPISVNGLSNATITVLISCPTYDTTSISKVEAIVQYNTPQRSVKYSTYATGTQTAPDSTLVGWWPLNGNAADQSGYGRNGTVTGTTVVADKNGQRNSAYQFNGTSDFISLGTNAHYDYPSFTVSLWAKANSSTQPHVKNLIGKGNWNETSNWYLGFKSGTHLSGVYGLTVTSPWNSGPSYALSSFDVTQWHLYTLTVSTTQQKLYMDGNLLATVNLSHGSVSGSTQDLQIARSSYAANFFGGIIDDIRIYNRELGDTEVMGLYNVGPQ